MKNTLYEDPEIYDILHAPGTAKDVRGLERIERLYSRAPKTAPTPLWLEPACGSGRYLLAAAGRGRRVAGFDLAPAMVDYTKARFKAKGLTRKGNLFVADMADFAPHLRPNSVSLAFNLINSIRHLDTDAALLAHFRDIAKVLHRGGVYAVGVSLSEYGIEFPTEDVWTGKRGRTTVHQVINFEHTTPTPPKARKNKAARVERAFSHLTITRGTGDRTKIDEAHATYGLRCYDLDQWYSVIGKSPLRVLTTCDERGTPIPPACPGYTLFILGRADHPAPPPPLVLGAR